MDTEQAAETWMEGYYNKMYDSFVETFPSNTGYPKLKFDREEKVIFLEKNANEEAESCSEDSQTEDFTSEELPKAYALQIYPFGGDRQLLPNMLLKSYIGVTLRCAKKMKIDGWEFKDVPFGIQVQLKAGMIGRIEILPSVDFLQVMSGIIDPGFQGEVKARICNFSDVPYVIEKYEEIANLYVLKAYPASIWELTEPIKAPKNDGGFDPKPSKPI